MTQILPANYLLFNRYEILEPIGQGGFGITYKALDRLENDLVCVKELFISGNSSRDGSLGVVSQSFGNVDFAYFKRRFLDEANTLSKIKHENIVKVRDYFEVNDTAYMVMDYIKGQNLKDWIEQKGKLNEKEALDLFSQLLNAVEAVHEYNILHRDIKPDNIILTPEKKLVLIDFGTAKFNDNAVHNHSTLVVVNHGYAPPEQFSSDKPKGKYTDVYALGATLYFMLTAQKPAPPSDRMIEDLKPIKAFNTEVSKKVQAAIFKALNLKPSERFQSVRAFREVLFTGTTVSSDSTVVVEVPQKPPLNKWPLMAGVGLVALVLIVFLLYPRDKETVVAENSKVEEVDSSAWHVFYAERDALIRDGFEEGKSGDGYEKSTLIAPDGQKHVFGKKYEELQTIDSKKDNKQNNTNAKQNVKFTGGTSMHTISPDRLHEINQSPFIKDKHAKIRLEEENKISQDPVNEYISSENEVNKLIIKIGGRKIEVHNKNLGKMTWDAALKSVEKLGSNWRLPTIEELEQIYTQLYLNGKGNFNQEDYWSSQTYYESYAWYFAFSNGKNYTGDRMIMLNVRAVRSL